VTKEATTAKALSVALGVSAPRVCQLRKFDWFPKGPPWNIEKARQAIEKNRRRAPRGNTNAKKPSRPQARKRKPAVKKKTEAEAEPTPTAHYPAEILAVLEDSSSDPVAIGDAAVRLAAIRFAHGLRNPGAGGSQDLQQLKQSMEELRKARADYLELGVRKGNLIERSVAKALAGRLVQQLLGILANVEAMLPVQVEIWMALPEFRESAPEKRRVSVSHWFRAQANEMREAGSDELERLLKAEGS